MPRAPRPLVQAPLSLAQSRALGKAAAHRSGPSTASGQRPAIDWSGQAIRIPPQLKHGTRGAAAAPAKCRSRTPTEIHQGLVIHEDASTFVLNKPSGIATRRLGNWTHIDGLLEGFRQEAAAAAAIHRLDRDTSASLSCAHASAAASLSESLRRRTRENLLRSPKESKAPSRRHQACSRQGRPQGHDERHGTAATDEADANPPRPITRDGTARISTPGRASPVTDARTSCARISPTSHTLVGISNMRPRRQGWVRWRTAASARRSIDSPIPKARLKATGPLPPHMAHA